MSGGWNFCIDINKARSAGLGVWDVAGLEGYFLSS